MKVLRKTTALLLVITLLASAFIMMGAVQSQAASYPTNYPNTHKNTGKGALDIVSVARTQVGYQENYYGTKYGHWYNTYFVNQPWCAMFVSWCAHQAGIPETTIPKFAACGTGVEWFQAMGRWHYSKAFGGNYTPVAGDIIFYKDAGFTGISTHVGIVAGLNGNYIVALEGNSTNGAVCEHTTSTARSLNSSYVLGYGHPNYSNDVENEPTTYESWMVDTTLTLRKSATTSSKALDHVPASTIVKVKKFTVADDYIWGYITYSGTKGWIALDYCTYIMGNIKGTYYQLKPTITKKATIYSGSTKKLTTTNALGGTFSTSDKEIAKVSKKGVVTAVSEGTATITLETATGTATSKITVKDPYIKEENPTACIGDTVSLSIVGSNVVPTWSSSDKEIAKVSKKGVVTGISKGTATISAKLGDITITKDVVITKTPKLYENFKVAGDKVCLKDSYKTQKNLCVVPKGTVIRVDEVYYSSTYTWGHTTYKKNTGWIILNKCEFVNGSINGKHYLIHPFVVKNEVTLDTGGEHRMVLHYPYEPLTFESENPEIATVSSKGLVVGVHGGETRIIAHSGKYNVALKVTVVDPVLSASTLTLVKDKTKVLSVKGGTSDIRWVTRNPEIAEVDEFGKITAIAEGSTKIIAVRDNIKMVCKLTVVNPALNATYKKIRIDQTKTLKVSGSSGATVKWSSSDKSVLKINSKGEMTGVKLGKAVVTAKVDGVSLTCNVTVVKKA